MGKLKIFGKDIIDDKAVEQIKNCYNPEIDHAVITADGHYGYSMPIGGVVAYKNHVSPSGVGFDIACGNYAVRTDIKVEQVDISNVMDEIIAQIGFGVGRPNPNPIDHPIFDKIAKADFSPQRELLNMARPQLGTVGS